MTFEAAIVDFEIVETTRVHVRSLRSGCSARSDQDDHKAVTIWLRPRSRGSSMSDEVKGFVQLTNSVV